ncbi:MAG: hypothetical protein F6K19_17285 [Cyanothece sp. SIO1E1]|nr:hypothetical protein [Cyanothece sp. SIO1E1]
MADELRAALELATEDELQALTGIMFSRRFNPLDYLYTPDPADVQSQDYVSWLDILEDRFRFLAADGFTTLRRRTKQVTYRQVLIQVCDHLKVPYAQSFCTTELEAEVFLHLLERDWHRMSKTEKKVLQGRVQSSLGQFQLTQKLPVSVQQDPLGLVLKGGSAFAVSSVLRPWLLHHIARQFAMHVATYQVAKQTLIRGGIAVATQLQHRTALHMAARGMAINSARYSAVRGIFACLGPTLWTWFLADLGWRTIATNYGRVIPVVFALAQIRLTRTECLEPAWAG